MSKGSENLRTHQEQADFDGSMVTVSRQALEETLEEYERMFVALKGVVAVADRKTIEFDRAHEAIEKAK